MENKKVTWYPGHMFKAKKEIIDILKTIDLVIEVIDSRVPNSAHNEMLFDLIKNKEHGIVFTKADLVDINELNEFIERYEEENYKVLIANLKKNGSDKKIIKFIKDVSQPLIEKYQKRGLQKNIRVLIIGMPNVGKSTLINCITSKKATITGNTPGVTKNQQIIKVDKNIELVDTPGILVPKLDTLERAYNLVLNSLIKDDVVELQDVAFYLLRILIANKSSALLKVYSYLKEGKLLALDLENIDDIENMYIDLSRSMGIAIKDNEIDYGRISIRLINDYRKQKFGKLILDNYEDKE